MKRDAKLGIALMLLGGLGLVYTNNLQAIGTRSNTPTRVQMLHTGAKSTGMKQNNENPASKGTACPEKMRRTASDPNLLQKVSVALTNLNSVVSLQSIGSGI